MKSLLNKAFRMLPNALAFFFVIGIGFLVSAPAEAALTMQQFIAPFTELRSGFLTFVALGCAAVILISLFMLPRAPGAAIVVIVVTIVAYILMVAALA